MCYHLTDSTVVRIFQLKENFLFFMLAICVIIIIILYGI